MLAEVTQIESDCGPAKRAPRGPVRLNSFASFRVNSQDVPKCGYAALWSALHSAIRVSSARFWGRGRIVGAADPCVLLGRDAAGARLRAALLWAATHPGRSAAEGVSRALTSADDGEKMLLVRGCAQAARARAARPEPPNKGPGGFGLARAVMWGVVSKAGAWCCYCSAARVLLDRDQQRSRRLWSGPS